MKLLSTEIAAYVGGRAQGAEVLCESVSIDSRTLSPGALFVAIRGEHADGHAFLESAIARGARAALVERATPGSVPTIQVADTRKALAELAQAWRARFDIPVVGVTGSNGKTTVKGMLASILGQMGPGTATAGNLNNDLGVPLTLLRMQSGDRFAVVEMGMNHAGEIAVLTRWSRPTVAVITNAAAAHLEGLGSVAAVAQAKGEIFSGLAQSGTAVINAADPYQGLWRDLAAGRRIVTFGAAGADVSGNSEIQGSGQRIDITLSPALGGGRVRAQLALLGRHNLANALAATAAAVAAGATLEQVRAGLEVMRPVPGRLAPVQAAQGGLILDDTYNANPGSVRAAIEVLRAFPAPRILILGDMLELGSESQEQHAAVGHEARAAGIEKLLAVGPAMAAAVAAFGSGGQHFADVDALAGALAAHAGEGVTLLVKGSRGMRMERVVQRLAPHSPGEVH